MDPLVLLQTDMKNAMKSGDKQRLDAVRYLIAQVQNLQIEKGREVVLTEGDLHVVVKKLLKNTEEAVAQYRTGGRDDLADEDQQRIDIWKTYLPQQLSDEELLTIVKDVYNQNPGLGIGPLTGMVLRQAGGKADGTRVGSMLKTMTS